MDNFYLRERLAGEQAAGRTSVSPGLLYRFRGPAAIQAASVLRERLAGEEAAGRTSVSPGLFYRFRVSADIEFVCFDTSKEDFFKRGRLFEYPKHWDFMQ